MPNPMRNEYPKHEPGRDGMNPFLTPLAAQKAIPSITRGSYSEYKIFHEKKKNERCLATSRH